VAAALDALREMDLVFVHVEAPDEAGHSGELKLKLQAIGGLLTLTWWGPCGRGWISRGLPLLLLCDHLTPLALRTIPMKPVPFILTTPGPG